METGVVGKGPDAKGMKQKAQLVKDNGSAGWQMVSDIKRALVAKA